MKPTCAPSKEDNGQHVVNKENTNSSTWGDSVDPPKNNNNLRIMLQNVNGIGYNEDTIWKSEKIKDMMNKFELDAFLMTEVNVNWKKVPRKFSLEYLTQYWFENSTNTFSYNQRDRSSTKSLPGGTAIVTKDELANRKISNSGDKIKIGRWSSTQFRGKDGITLRIVSVYVPCMSTQYGSKKVYCQQQKALLQLGIKEPTIVRFWKDFWEQIDEWIDDGDRLIIGGDWNADVRKEVVMKPFTERNMVPAVITKHGLDGPETYQRGSKPIDEFFVSTGIEITAAGYLAHGEGIGDHRPIWIEATKLSTLGAKLPEVPKFKARRLKCQDPRVIKKYNKLLDEQLQANDVYNRLDILFRNTTEGKELGEAQMEEYEKLDNIREEAMIYAEKNCRHLYMGGIQWCPLLTRHRNRIDYLRRCISRKKGTKINARTLIRKAIKARIDASTFTMEELLKALDKEYEEYKNTKKNHIELRKSFLESLAEAKAAEGKGRKATHLRNLIRLEEQRAMYRKIKSVTGRNGNLGTTFVTVKDSEGNKKDIIGKEELERAIIAENTKKYHQTEKTCPFIYDATLRSDFGDMGEGPATQQLFQGTYNIPTHLDKYTKAYLRVCQQNRNHLPAQFERTEQDYKLSWEKMDERISSRRLHFGHFKAACKHESIINAHYKMAEIPFRTGYAPERWKNATNVMILKKAGLYDIDRLRTIVLYEADFNHNNKYFGRQMMKHTQQQNMLAKEQYSVPGRKAIDHALNRRLIFDIVRYQKSSMAMTDCDLKSCYDRIAHSPAYLAMVGYRYLPTPILSMFTCIQDAKWVTRTAYGDSDITFGGFDQDFWAKPQGAGQGNGSGPPVWSTVSSRMFEVLHNEGLHTSFVPPINTSDKLDICGFAFVDDSDIISAANNKNDPETTIKNMQETIDWWEGVAKTTGGALEPSKSWWYLIHFDWEDGDWKYGDAPEGALVTALNKDNERVELQNIPVSKTQTMLGVDLSPNGDNKMQIEILKKKMNTMAEKIRTANLNHNETWTALTTMAMKTLEYPLPASTFTEQELASIVWPLLKTYLPKSGINRHISRKVLFGPISVGGLGLKNPYLTQIINHAIDIVDHSWKKTITGQLIMMSLEHLRLEIGSNCNILECKASTYKDILLTKSWIRHTWEGFEKYGITIQIDVEKVKLRRINDKCIMDEIILNDALTRTEKNKVNKCRIFLKVFTLADIVSGDGKRISPFAITGERDDRRTRVECNWPLWGKPSKSDWKAWNKGLNITFCKQQNNHLDEPLGPWTIPLPQEWEWFEHLFDDRMYRRKDDNDWELFHKMGRSVRHQRYLQYPSSTKANKDVDKSVLLPTTVTKHGNTIRTEGISNYRLTEELTTQDNKYTSWLRYSAESSDTIDQVINSIRDGSAYGVSDGSYCPERRIGAAAWIIYSNDGNQYISGTSISPGPSYIQNAYRSELVGILGMLDAMTSICHHKNIKRGKTTIACDGISALDQAMRNDVQRISCKMKQSDIISACIQLHQALPIQIEYQHVKGHQDELKKYDELNKMERANVRMDNTAKNILQIYSKTDQQFNTNPGKHPLSFANISWNNNTIMSDVSSRLYENIAGEELHNHWISKQRYDNTTRQSILWEPFKHAIRNSTTTRRRFVSKWISTTMGTGKNMKLWKLRPHSNCPYCMQEDETTNHILQCNHIEASMAWDKSMIKWFATLLQLGIDTLILRQLRQSLLQWKQHDNGYIEEDRQTVLIAQENLGWTQYLEGLLVPEWFDLIYKDNGSNTDRTISILSKMIRANWEFIFSIWTERNDKLHETDRIKDLEGRPQLLEAIDKEWNIGLSALPHNDFGYLFTTNKEILLQKPLDCLKDWLAIIRGGRELFQDRHLIHDDFSDKGILRTWIGLS